MYTILKNKKRDGNFFISHACVMQLHPRGDYGSAVIMMTSTRCTPRLRSTIIVHERPRLSVFTVLFRQRFRSDFNAVQ